MNREIKFRGKRLNGQWAYGLLCHDPEKGKAYDSEWFISNKAGKPYAFAIAPSTIGEYTGLKDKDGNEIYEGDIIAILDEKGKVVYDSKCACFKVEVSRSYCCDIVSYVVYGCRIIGNIYEQDGTMKKYQVINRLTNAVCGVFNTPNEAGKWVEEYTHEQNKGLDPNRHEYCSPFHFELKEVEDVNL